MKIAVCVKQVPDSEQIKIDPLTNTLQRESAQAVLNPFDLFAVEEAIRLNSRIAGSSTTALTMGPIQASSSLREAVSMGIGYPVLLCDRLFAGADSWATSYVLAAGIKKCKASLVICGKQATDGDTAQVGPAIAAHLEWPQVCYVTEILKITDKHAVVRRLMDHGRETVRVELPAVLTVLKEANNPRLPTLPGILKGRATSIEHWDASALGVCAAQCGLKGSPTRVRKILSPAKSIGNCQFIDGINRKESASKLAEIITAFI